MKKVSPARIIALVFALMGSLFAGIGIVFLCVTESAWDTLSNPAAWAGELPDEAALPVVGAVFAVMGVAMLLVAVIVLICARRAENRREELRTWGLRVTGKVIDISVDRTVRVNGRSPLRIVAQAQHPTTREEMVVKSQQVWETSLSVGDAVDVLFDPMEEKRYLVDVK